MKPKIAIFGLPSSTLGRLKVFIYANPVGNSYGDLIFESCNTEDGILLNDIDTELEIGSTLTVVIFSMGVCPYSKQLTFSGGDISLVPVLSKDTNIGEAQISQDWDLTHWNSWNPQLLHDEGIQIERRYVTARKIVTTPIWESYYIESSIDYFEKFHKLWVGLNSYANQYSNETRDVNKVLALVNSDLRGAFRGKLSQLQDEISSSRHKRIQQATGLNMTSNIVRDEIERSQSNSIIRFMHDFKSSFLTFNGVESGLVGGLAFLNADDDQGIFYNIYREYHSFAASEIGRVETCNLADAFLSPKAPKSVERYGSMLFHNPLEVADSGSLFSLETFFSSAYSQNPYSRTHIRDARNYEAVDPLFFRYLYLLYKFRCEYFHGGLQSNAENQRLARSAYDSLYELFPILIR